MWEDGQARGHTSCSMHLHGKVNTVQARGRDLELGLSKCHSDITLPTASPFLFTLVQHACCIVDKKPSRKTWNRFFSFDVIAQKRGKTRGGGGDGGIRNEKEIKHTSPDLNPI